MYAFETKAEVLSIPEIEDPTPGYYETSEYMIGSVAVGIIFVESNGTIDPSTEDWNSTEEQAVIEKIQYASNWWASQNPDANVSFVLDVHYKVPTSYEPINRNTDTEMALWCSEVMNYLGYKNVNYRYEVGDYVNDFRSKLNTDWSFTIFVIDASNDKDGLFADGWGAFSVGFLGASRNTIVVPVKTIDNLDWRVAHEMGHIFWATDEYNNKTEYKGYLNVSDIDGSGGIMNKFGSWEISGKPHGLNGTWGQIGWRDSDNDGIQDIVDTPQRVYLNPHKIIGNKVNITGVAVVTPYPNKNLYSSQRNVTINKIEAVEFRINSGEWQNITTITPWKFKKLVKYPDTYIEKETYAIVNYTFLTPELSPGEHFIEIKATNQWGNSGYANLTVTIPELVRDVAITSIKPYRTILANASSTSINVTVQNKGDTTETFNVTLFYNTSQIGTQTITLLSKQSTILNFKWTTPTEIGNYTITAIASQIPGETSIDDNTLTYSLIQISITGDLNADGRVNINDIYIVARAFQTNPGHERWNFNADLNEDGIINIQDIYVVARDYGKSL